MTGKWHVTKFVEATNESEKANWPRQRGFDHYFGVIKGTANYFRPDSLTRENEHIQAPPDGFYTTDAFVDNAIRFLDEGDKAKPFFLYVAFNAPHFPLMAPADEIARLRGKYKVGWDKLREQRHARQIALGIVDKAWPLSPRPAEVKAWDSLTPQEQDRFDHLMAIYAATVSHMDAAVGRLVQALRERGSLDNTLILFLSDNGACWEWDPIGFDVSSSPKNVPMAASARAPRTTTRTTCCSASASRRTAPTPIACATTAGSSSRAPRTRSFRATR